MKTIQSNIQRRSREAIGILKEGCRKYIGMIKVDGVELTVVYDADKRLPFRAIKGIHSGDKAVTMLKGATYEDMVYGEKVEYL